MLWVIFIIVLFLLVKRKWETKPFVELSKIFKCDIKSYPLIGHAYLFVGGGVSRMNGFEILGREALKHGGMTSGWLGLKYMVVAADPVDLEVILKYALEKDDLVRFPRFLLGNGIIFAPVSMWRSRRKILAPTFSPKNLNNFVQVFSRQSSIMVEQISKAVGKEAVSAWNFVTTYTLDAVFETVMNVKLNSQQCKEVPFLKSFSNICDLISSRILNPWLHPDMVYKLLPQYRTSVKYRASIWQFIDEIIKSCQRDAKNNRNKNDAMKSFLELIIESEDGEQRYNAEELREESLVLAVAGNDTSAVGTCFVLSMMARYPDVQEKVAKELHDVFGELDRPVVAEDLPHLKYLEVVIKETLRLYPPAPIIVRQIDKDLKLPSGITLVKECGVLVHIWATHRNQLYWGEDAEEFRPERFIDAPPKHSAAFLAFSHGPRACIGYQYAMMSMKTALATVLRSYRVLGADKDMKIDNTPMKLSYEIMIKDVDGFKVRLEKRTK